MFVVEFAVVALHSIHFEKHESKKDVTVVVELAGTLVVGDELDVVVVAVKLMIELYLLDN